MAGARKSGAGGRGRRRKKQKPKNKWRMQPGQRMRAKEKVQKLATLAISPFDFVIFCSQFYGLHTHTHTFAVLYRAVGPRY